MNILIKRAIDNIFTPPPSFNKNLVNVYIPMYKGSYDIQNIRVMEADYGYSITIGEYIYCIPTSSTSKGTVYKRVRRNWTSSDFQRVSESNYASEFGNKEFLFNVYRLDSNTGLTGELGQFAMEPLNIEYVYEISTRKYYKKEMVGN